jgi:hypothetical protein
VVAAGNPVDSGVRSLLPEELAAIPAARRPRFLAILITPGSSPAAQPFESWGYRPIINAPACALYEITLK